MAGDIDPGFGHDHHGPGIESLRQNAGGIGIDDLALQVTRPPLGHLAPAGIAGTQEKDPGFPLPLRHRFSVMTAGKPPYTYMLISKT
jgi:hypothetical protein